MLMLIYWKVVLANVSYKYTNYSDRNLMISELVPTDECYVSVVNGTMVGDLVVQVSGELSCWWFNCKIL